MTSIILYSQEAALSTAVKTLLNDAELPDTKIFETGWGRLFSTINLVSSQNFVILVILRKGRITSEIDLIPSAEKHYISQKYSNVPICILVLEDGLLKPDDKWLLDNYSHFKSHGFDFEELPFITGCIYTGSTQGLDGEVLKSIGNANINLTSKTVEAIQKHNSLFNKKQWDFINQRYTMSNFQLGLVFLIVALVILYRIFFWTSSEIIEVHEKKLKKKNPINSHLDWEIVDNNGENVE